MLTYNHLLPTGRAGGEEGREREVFFIKEWRDKSLLSLEAKNRAVKYARLIFFFYKWNQSELLLSSVRQKEVIKVIVHH